ncbi:2-keto-4-pentenoate hydratase [Amycolatopsis silviterrae]|uniref:2-keto-4-pentenoate hydratase n=1 Tax=Amycolatopsis silviterrae TaxID=1656914 RepID=A0ABW5H541_9PSEU
MQNPSVTDLAERLQHAARTGVPADPADIPGLAEAYAVAQAQRHLSEATGDRVIGYKIGLTSGPARKAFAATEPTAGHLVASRLLEPGKPVTATGLFRPKAEVEIAFVLASPIGGPNVTAADVRDATAAVAPAFEIVDTRWRGGPTSLPMLVADNTNAAAAVVGAQVPLPADLPAQTSILRIGTQTVPGAATAVMGDPAEAVAWLARHLARSGNRLEAGDIVLSGTLSTPAPIHAGDRLEAEISGVGGISVEVV